MKKKKMKTSNIVLLVLGILLVAFIIVNLWLFNKYQMVPDVLISSVLALFLSECGWMAWIRTAKSKYGDTGDDDDEEEDEDYE